MSRTRVVEVADAGSLAKWFGRTGDNRVWDKLGARRIDLSMSEEGWRNDDAEVNFGSRYCDVEGVSLLSKLSRVSERRRY
jgi:hypothetical protein